MNQHSQIPPIHINHLHRPLQEACAPARKTQYSAILVEQSHSGIPVLSDFLESTQQTLEDAHQHETERGRKVLESLQMFRFQSLDERHGVRQSQCGSIAADGRQPGIATIRQGAENASMERYLRRPGC